ncbi:ankyrin repeat domain-containing protein [Spirochaetota bacterium]
MKKTIILLIIMVVPLILNGARGRNLYYYSQEGNIKGIKAELQRGININVRDKQGLTALLMAMMYNRYEAMKLLISKGADVNALGLYNEPFIHMVTRYMRCRAFNKNYKEYREYLIKFKILYGAGANIHVKYNGFSAYELIRKWPDENTKYELLKIIEAR